MTTEERDYEMFNYAVLSQWIDDADNRIAELWSFRPEISPNEYENRMQKLADERFRASVEMRVIRDRFEAEDGCACRLLGRACECEGEF